MPKVDSGDATPVEFLRRRPDFAAVIGVVERTKGERWTDFFPRYGDWGRDLVLTLAFRCVGLKLKELGALVGGLDYVTVSAAIHRFEQKMQKDEHLADLFHQAQSQL